MICFRLVIVVLMGPYSWLLFRICRAYADCGSYCFMHLTRSWYLCFRCGLFVRCMIIYTCCTLVCIFHTFYVPVMLLVVLGLVRCIVLVLLKGIPTFVCLHRSVILRISGLYYVYTAHVFLSLSVLLFRS